jgi:hypothetical protein
VSEIEAVGNVRVVEVERCVGTATALRRLCTYLSASVTCIRDVSDGSTNDGLIAWWIHETMDLLAELYGWEESAVSTRITVFDYRLLIFARILLKS